MIKIINKEKKVDNFWTIFFCGMILLSTFGGVFSREIFNSPQLGYYVNYLLWISLGIVFVIKERKIPFSKGYIIIFSVILLNTLAGAILGRIVLNLRVDNLHQGFITGLAILAVMGISWNDYLKKEDFLIIMKVIFGIGVIASVYAMIIQNQNWIGVLMGIERRNNAWIYRSFFGQRNIFAYFCFLSSTAGTYLFRFTRQKKYLLGMALLALQIYITDSRTAVIVLLLFYIIYIYLRLGKRERIFLLILAGCIFVFIVGFTDLSVLIGRFYHETNTAYGDSGSLRLNMWYSGITYLFSNKAFLTGFGFDSQGPYLNPMFRLESFHNAYIDIFFQGGIILLGIHLYLLGKVIKSILLVVDQKCKYISISFVAAFLFGCLFDSSAMLFSSNYEAVLSTLMVCVLSKIQTENNFCVS